MLKQEIKSSVSVGVPMPPVEEINEVVGIPRVVTELDDRGKLVSKVVFEETPIEKLNDGLKVDDFALEVLLQNGYEPHRLDNSSVSFEDIERLSSVASSLPSDKETIANVKPYVKKGE